MLTFASADVGTSFPVVSNLDTVRAANKISRNPQSERKPHDIKNQVQRRKRARDTAEEHLAALQTPIVEAHRPSKKTSQ